MTDATVADSRHSATARRDSSDGETQVIAFYLPQFHPTPENDVWWGPGFTEWTNVTRARPLFPGHRQPHLPSDLGFYDLRVPEVRDGQARLAAQSGITAFCYWHYWFAGRRILERPFAEVLASQSPDFPFCLGWANQTWTGSWHGADDRILIEQTYPEGDDAAHFDLLLSAFTDPRYVRVDGRPLLYIFRPEELPEPARWVERWRSLADRAGLPGLYLVAEISDLLGTGPRYAEHHAHGFDAGVYVRLPVELTAWAQLRMRASRKLLRGPEIYSYARRLPPYPRRLQGTVHPCVYPNWDNTPRSGRRGLVITGSSPERFRPHVREALRLTGERSSNERLLFIKSWNEWAEGNYLEPDQVDGHGYLRVLSEELRSRAPYGRAPDPAPSADGDPPIGRVSNLGGHYS